jgi:hypothetical protein
MTSIEKLLYHCSYFLRVFVNYFGRQVNCLFELTVCSAQIRALVAAVLKSCVMHLA